MRVPEGIPESCVAGVGWAAGPGVGLVTAAGSSAHETAQFRMTTNDALHHARGACHKHIEAW